MPQLNDGEEGLIRGQAAGFAFFILGE